MKGLIKKSTGNRYEIWDEDLNVITATYKGKFKIEGIKSTNPISVGDYVEYIYDEQHKIALIESLYPRNNYIIRKSNNLSKQTHIIASNIDRMIILVTIGYPRTSQGFIDRLLLTAEAYHIPVMIVFNKTDLHFPEMDTIMNRMIEMYSVIGYNCFQVSAKTGAGFDKIRTEIQGKTVLITGHSGTGKSTFLNRLNPEFELKTGGISLHSLKGKHTTTFAEMHHIFDDTFIIDTPGIKEFGIVDLNSSEISQYFPEMKALIGKCKFNNCIHINEPGCAVLDAVEKGEINPARYKSYLSIVSNEDRHH